MTDTLTPQLLEALPFPALLFRSDGGVDLSNGRWRKLTGLDAEASAKEGWANAIREDQRERVLVSWRSCCARRAALETETAIGSTSGREPRWHMLKIVPQSDGPDAQWLGILVDIDERRQREGALVSERDRYEKMLEVMPQMAWATDPKGAPLFRSRRWQMYTGSDELLSTHGLDVARELVHPDDREDAIAVWLRSFASGEPYEYEARVKSVIDGRYRWFLSRAVPIRDANGEVVQWIGTSTDIENQKRTQQRNAFLAQASAALAEVLDYESTLRTVAGLAVPAFADWCAVDLMNDSGELHRVAVTHTDPNKVALAHRLHERYPPEPDAPSGVMAVLRTGEPEFLREIPDELLEAGAKDAEHLALIRTLGLRSYICVPLRLRLRVIGVLTFVTAESERRYGAGDLEMACDLARRAQIAIDNALLYKELHDADRQKDDFLATLAHELRNPLAPLTLGLELMAQQREDATEHERTRARLVRQVNQIVRLVDDLLDVSRISRGKLTLDRKTVRVHDIVQAAVETSMTAIERGGHRLEVSSPDSELLIDADPARVSQVLSNLLHNAAKYTTSPGEIHLTVRATKNEIAVAVEDTGVGLAPDSLDRIFDMFVQVESSQRGLESGLGLGLTLVRRLVQMHDGRVEATSEGLGRGSRFVVHLPRSAESKVSSATPEPVEAPDAKLRVLVVDDNVDAADTLGDLLTLIGCSAKTAYGGEQAVIVAERFRPHLVFLDLGMPVVDGYEVARRIRQEPWGEAVVLVALTGWGQPGDRQRTRDAGFDEHFVKPVDVDRLRAFLAEQRPT